MIVWQSWEKGAEVFEYYLIDADWSINNFNWQWLSCTAHFYQYFRCYSPVAFGKKTDPNGDFIRKWLPQFKDVPKKYIYEPWEMPPAMQEKHGIIIGKDYPYPIIEHKSMSKANMGRMKEAYDAQKSGQVRTGSQIAMSVSHRGEARPQTRRSTLSNPLGNASSASYSRRARCQASTVLKGHSEANMWDRGPVL